MDATLLERDDALAAIGAAVGAGVVVVQGPAGRGKTAVLDAVAGRSGAAHVLRGYGEPAAAAWPFGLLVEALAPFVTDAALSGAAAGARPLFEGGAAEGGAAPAELSARWAQALVALLARLGEEGGVLLCADDVHRADEQSLGVLVRLGERALPRGLAVVAAARSEPAGRSALLERLLAASAVVEPAPLSPEAVGELLRARGRTTVTQADRERAHALTGGNPFLVEQLAVALDAGLPELAGNGSQLGAAGRRIVALIAAQGPEPLELARALAALGREATVARAGRVAGLDTQAAARAAGTLRHLDVLRDAGTDPARLHDLVTQALLDDAGAAGRRRLRAAGATVLAADGAPAARVAALLMDAEPAGDEGAVAVLERAAAGARNAGAPDEAVRLLERALLEPPEPGSRLRVRLALAEARGSLGDAAAEDDFRAALDLAASEPSRVEVLLALSRARVQQGRFPAATEAVAEAEAAMGASPPPELARAVRAASILARSFTGPGAEAGPHSLPPGDPAQLAQSVLTASITGAIDAAGARALARRALDEGRLAGGEPGVISMITGVLYFTGDLDTSIALSGEAMDAPGRSPAELGVLHYLRAGPLLMRGRLAEAEAAALASIAGLEPESGWVYGGHCMLASTRLETQGADAALRVFAEAGLPAPPPGIVAQVWHAHRARVLMAAGDAAEALEAALEGARNAIPGTEPYGMTIDDWRAPAAQAHLALGDRAAASAMAREALELQERWGAPASLVQPLLVLGLAEDDQGRLDRAVAASREGEDIRLRLEALVHRGAARRRAGATRGAREDLYAALEVARAHGFARLGRRAADELAAAGARKLAAPRSGAAALTASETRVVRLAAAGASNRQIATDLFLSLKTVEFHLSNAYRKLGVTSRTELRAALGSRHGR